MLDQSGALDTFETHAPRFGWGDASSSRPAPAHASAAGPAAPSGADSEKERAKFEGRLQELLDTERSYVRRIEALATVSRLAVCVARWPDVSSRGTGRML